MMRPVPEDAVASDEDDSDNDDNEDESKERIRGVIFGRSVRSSYCVLHVARFLQEPDNDDDVEDNEKDDDPNNTQDDDDNLEPILIRLQFQQDPRALRSYCRRFCKLGDLLHISGAWKAIDETIETEWQSPRLIVDLSSQTQAQAALTVVRVRYWTIQKCQSWQCEYLKMSNPMQNRRRVVVDDDDDDESENNIVTPSTTKASASTSSHGGGLGKRTQGEYVTNFLIHMLMNTPTCTLSVRSADQTISHTDPSTWATLDPRKQQPQPPHDADADTDAYQRAIDKLNAGTGVVDAAGGSGHVSMALGMRGIRSTVVDPRENVGKLPGRDRKIFNRAIRSPPRPPLPPPACAITVKATDASTSTSIPYCQPVTVQYGTMRAWFGAPPAGVDETFRQPDKPTQDLAVCSVNHPLLSTCSAIIALHPDEATDAIVDTAVARRIPFCIVPCCVFFRLFPHRRKPGSRDPVSTHADLLEYLMAKDETIQQTTLPFAGANVVLWSRF
jgi:hypothetical protein